MSEEKIIARKEDLINYLNKIEGNPPIISMQEVRDCHRGCCFKQGYVSIPLDELNDEIFYSEEEKAIVIDRYLV